MIQFDMPDTAVTDSIAAAREAKIKALEAMPVEDLINSAVNGLVHFAINLAIAILVFYVGKFIIKKLYQFTLGVFVRRNVDRSLTTFILSMIRIVLFFILIVTVIGILGIETSSFLAIFASAGVAIGMALSGTLQNFAGGVLILLLKPYKIGDYIEAQGYAGTVKEIQIFHTIITTPDNQSIIIPNGGLSTGSINNYSREDYRRVDWTVSIAYGNSFDAARDALLAILLSDPRVVREYIEDDRADRARAEAEAATEADSNGTPSADDDLLVEEALRPRPWWRRIFSHHTAVKDAISKWEDARQASIIAHMGRTNCKPVVVLGELADSSVNITMRAWTRSENYWGLKFDINERIYKELPAAGIDFPFPQMDVHITR
ncbi:MAG: mechanosensitive ion channel [Pseudoflavonifractor sp.]|nr:mechanosensitive ion channel [Pseudoflavonifractor sp.]